MLESIHKHMKWVMWIIVILVSVAFIFTIGEYPTGGESRTVAKVNGEVITFGQWNRAYQRLHETYRSVLKEQMNEQFTKTLRAQALSELIADRLLVGEAERMGLRVTAKELQDSISRIPTFSRQGVFNQKQYEWYLSRVNLTPAAFEEGQREFLLRLKIERLIREAVDVTGAELATLYLERNPKSRPSDFEKNRSSFRKTVLEERQGMALNAYVQGLRARSEITVNASMIDL